MDLDELEATAYHEAGHLAARLLLGGRIMFVTIQPDPFGRTYGRVVPDYRVLLPKSHQIVIALAGPMAERRFRAGDEPTGDQGDWDRAIRDAFRIAKGDMEQASALLDKLEGKASILVNTYWPAIERTASALLVFGRLDGDTACRQASGIWHPIGVG